MSPRTTCSTPYMANRLQIAAPKWEESMLWTLSLMMSPDSTKMKLLARKPIISQNSWFCFSVLRPTTISRSFPRYTPKATTASTPDTWRWCSARKKVVYTPQTSSEISVKGSPCAPGSCSAYPAPMPMARPHRGPPRESWRKVVKMVDGLMSTPPANSRKMANTTNAVPSLSRDSPSMRWLSLSGAPSVWRTATTATGSVALRMEPISIAVFISHPSV
mmetsp:Transcript_86681/g.173413  ORF Transcript_86681/g.173413 Transcript_86681/m.173413 type:complete len:218 (-) Transcript_86681:597-1250(-)